MAFYLYICHKIFNCNKDVDVLSHKRQLDRKTHNKVNVYHGTNMVIEHPQIINRFKTLDFGEGFYTTENENQARDFAVKVCTRRIPALIPIVNCYELNEDFNCLSILKFDAPNEQWLDFVVERRRGVA